MTEFPCPSCGSRNPPDSQFCISCGSFLDWSDEQKTGVVPTADRTARTPAPQPWGAQSGQYGWESLPVPQQAAPSLRRQQQPQPGGSPAADSDLRVDVEQSEAAVVTPGGAPVSVTLHLANTSSVVEAYRVTAIAQPTWLVVTPAQARLLPGTDERVNIGLSVAADDLVPVQRLRVTLRAQGESSRHLHRDVLVEVEVGAVVAPAQVRLEPSKVRVQDETSAGLRVHIDNRHSNVPMTFDLGARDPEQAMRYAFQPVRLTVPPGGSGVSQLWFEAPLPAPGEQVSRTVTVTATGEDQELTANAEVHQAASAIVVDPPVVLRLDPSVVHADRRSGVTHVILDNRRGTRPQRIHLEARDDENAVQSVLEPRDLVVEAGQYAMSRLTLRAPRPRAGETAARSLVVTAWNGHQSVETQGQLVQETAARRPFMRVLLTLLGSAAMIFGAFQPWTQQPRLTGVEWNYPGVPRQLNLPTDPVDNALSALGVADLVSSVVSVGAIVIVLGLIAALGIFSSTGRPIKGAAVWGAIVLLLFAAVMVTSFFVDQGFPALAFGWGIALAGCGLAFAGSFFARP